MAYNRGKYGIEYNARPPDEDSSPVVLLIVGIVALLAIISFAVSRLVKHDDPSEIAVIEKINANQTEITVNTETAKIAEKPSEIAVSAPITNRVRQSQRPKFMTDDSFAKRPALVRNLLMRMEIAARNGDDEMEIGTISKLRNLAGEPVADIDDILARRLGELNFKQLFVKKSKEWVKDVVVRRGDNATRIAHEHGSTLASLKKLNADIDRLKVGMTLKVMEHPRFNLVIHRRAQTADLIIDDKFFKRYYPVCQSIGKNGTFEFSDLDRSFRDSYGISFALADSSEIELLVTFGSSVSVSDL